MNLALSDQIADDSDVEDGLIDRLKMFIGGNDLKTGDKIPPERSLAASFGVSRSSMRKALQRLADCGVLTKRRGDGTYVGPNGAGEFKLDAERRACRVFMEVMRVRLIIEPALAAPACANHSAQQLDQLKIITCDQQARLVTGREDGGLDADFHYQLALCTGNSILADIMKRLNENYKCARLAGLRDGAWRQFSVNSHLRIISALERRAAKECRAEIEHHLSVVMEKHPFLQHIRALGLECI